MVRWCSPNKFSIIGTVFTFDDAIPELDTLEEITTCTDDGDDCKPKSPTPSLADTQAWPPPPPALHTVPTDIKNAECVHVARLPDSFGIDDLFTEFSRFGQVVGANILLGPKVRPVKCRHSVVWYDLLGTADAVIQFGTVTLTNGDVVAVKKETNNGRPSPGDAPC